MEKYVAKNAKEIRAARTIDSTHFRRVCACTYSSTWPVCVIVYKNLIKIVTLVGDACKFCFTWPVFRPTKTDAGGGPETGMQVGMALTVLARVGSYRGYAPVLSGTLGVGTAASSCCSTPSRVYRAFMAGSECSGRA